MVICMKGYVYTLEVLLAVSVVFLTMVFVFKIPDFSPDTTVIPLKLRGEDVLKNMDSRGILRLVVAEGNEEALRNNITALLSQNIGFDVRICSPACEAPVFPGGKNIVNVRYYISAASGYDISSVQLWLWVLE